MKLSHSSFAMLGLLAACTGRIIPVAEENGNPSSSNTPTSTDAAAPTGPTPLDSGLSISPDPTPLDSGSISPDPTPLDASPSTPLDAGLVIGTCTDIVPGGSSVFVVFEAGPAPNTGSGGTITDGYYDLVADTIYQSSATDMVFSEQETVLISGGGTFIDYVACENCGADANAYSYTHISSTIAPSGSNLNATTVCPAGTNGGIQIGPYYTATATDFQIVNGLYIEVFEKRP